MRTKHIVSVLALLFMAELVGLLLAQRRYVPPPPRPAPRVSPSRPSGGNGGYRPNNRPQSTGRYRESQVEMRRQSQPYRDEQRRVQMARQREEALSVERNRRIGEMLQAKQTAKLAGASRGNQAADRMVFSNGVAKLTRPLTPGEIRRGFTGKITPDGRALVKFRNRVFAVPASGLGIKLGSPQSPKAQLLSSSSLSTGQRRVLQESTAQLVALDVSAKASARVAAARANGPNSRQPRSGLGELSPGPSGRSTKPGPILDETYVRTFRNRQYSNRQATGDEVWYVYHGEENGLSSSHNSRMMSGKKPAFFITNRKYETEEALRQDCAILREWGDISTVTTIRPAAGTWVSEGYTSEQVSDSGERRPGGGYQAIIDTKSLGVSTIVSVEKLPSVFRRIQ